MAEATVNSAIAAYDDMADHWALPVALKGGTLDMQAAKTTYLPQFGSEGDTQYDDRRESSVLYNAFGRTIAVLSGEPLRKPITLTDPSAKDEEIASDVDLAGRDINAYAGQLLDDLLTFGKAHFFVAYPNTRDIEARNGRALTMRDEIDLQVRPYFVRADSQNVIGWRGRRQDGVEVLDRVRVREVDVEESGNWGEKQVKYVRVYYPDHIERYRQPEKAGSQWPLVESVENTLGYVPLVTVYAKRLALMTAYSPLEDLAWVNLQHWQSSSDQHNILHMARTYLLALYGWEPDDASTIDIGVTKALVNRNTDAHAEVVEHSGAAIEAGRQQLIDLQEQMRSLGTDMLTPRPDVSVTATQVQIDKGEMISELQLITHNLEAGFEQGFAIAADWQARKLSEGFAVNINQEFTPAALSTSPLKDVQSLYGLGKITGRRLLIEHKRYGVLSDDVDVDQELADAAEESDLEGAFEPDLEEQEDEEGV